MVTQTRTVLERYRDAGAEVRIEVFEGSGHGPLIDAGSRWAALFLAFLDDAERQHRKVSTS